MRFHKNLINVYVVSNLTEVMVAMYIRTVNNGRHVHALALAPPPIVILSMVCGKGTGLF